jgi:hypothetical protein
MTDELWRWKFAAPGESAGQQLYEHFWRRALRWLAGELETGRLSVNPERTVLQPGEDVSVGVRFLDAKYEPRQRQSVRLELRDGSGGKPHNVYSVTTDGEGDASATISPESPGVYRVYARPEPEEEEQPEATSYIRVRGAEEEKRDLSGGWELLRWIARETGGSYQNLADGSAPRALSVPSGSARKLISRTAQPLWSNVVTYALVVGLLCVEWWLRRRRGVM